jgi:hypothetical protein
MQYRLTTIVISGRDNVQQLAGSIHVANDEIMAELLRTVFIGCGKRARAHAAGVVAEPRLRVVGVADVNASAAEAMKTDFKFDQLQESPPGDGGDLRVLGERPASAADRTASHGRAG